MRSTGKSKSLTGSALLNFNPQVLWRKAFRDAPSAANITAVKADVSSEIPTKNRLIHNNALYLSEPDEVRECIEKLLPNHAFTLVLTNKMV